MADGKLTAALSANPAGVLLGAISIWYLPAITRAAVAGRVWTDRQLWLLAIGLMSVIVTAVLHWMGRLT